MRKRDNIVANDKFADQRTPFSKHAPCTRCIEKVSTTFKESKRKGHKQKKKKNSIYVKITLERNPFSSHELPLLNLFSEYRSICSVFLDLPRSFSTILSLALSSIVSISNERHDTRCKVHFGDNFERK